MSVTATDPSTGVRFEVSDARVFVSLHCVACDMPIGMVFGKDGVHLAEVLPERSLAACAVHVLASPECALPRMEAL